ncbi:MAG: HU family DNA-binding protein [Bacteroidaceae bacterium]|nr:HU family DNA-binding protein [Bacteroidaceae bacterium]
MNEKLNIQNLSDELAESYGMNKKNAEAFVKEFFSLIEDGLERDKYIKIKGFGTFKLIDVDSRESINVNTGERFEIQGHSKVTFTPDNNIKEAVNKPFSAFQTVVLADGVTIEGLEENLSDALSDDLTNEPNFQEDSEEEPISENVVDDKTALPIEKQYDIEEPMPVISTQENTINEEQFEVKTEHDIEESSSPIEIEEPKIKIEEPKVEKEMSETHTSDNKPEEDPSQVKILQMFDDDAIKKKDQPISHHQEVMALKITEEKRKEISKKAEGSFIPYLMFLAVLVIILCMSAIAYIYFPDLAENEEVKITTTHQFSNSAQNDNADIKIAAADQEQEKGTQKSTTSTTVSTEIIKEPVKKEMTTPITVREESVPATSSLDTKPAVAVKEQVKPIQDNLVQSNTDKSTPTNNLKADVAYKVDGEICVHELKRGETLFALSRKYYGPNSFYTYIVEYNKDIIKDPDNVPIGTKLRIPRLIKK